MHPTRYRRRPVDILEAAEVEAMLRQLSRRSPTGKRDRALVALLWRTGLRISEALQLQPADLDPGEGILRVQHGKGDKPRTLGFDTGTAEMVERWLAARRLLVERGLLPETYTGPRGKRLSSPLFCTLARSARWTPGRPLDRRDVWTRLRRLARAAGIEKRVHPHGLRHTHAVEVYFGEGWTALEVQEELGHESLDYTERYLRHVAPRERIRATRRRTWTPPD